MDFQSTSFVLKENGTPPKTLRLISVEDKIEFQRIQKEIEWPFYLSTDAIKLIESPKYDLFRLPTALANFAKYLVTEDLVAAVREEKLTGVRFRLVDDPYNKVI